MHKAFFLLSTDSFVYRVILYFSIRMQGSAAINLCTLASGGADACYEFGLHVWDIAAAGLVVEEAGGVVLDPSGKIIFIFRCN